MEKVPEFEQRNSPENQGKGPEDRVVRLFKEKGSEDPEARDLLINWIIEQEKQVEESNDSEAVIQFNLRRARLYLRIGFKEEALENFEAARVQAWNEHRDDLYEAIEKEMNGIVA